MAELVCRAPVDSMVVVEERGWHRWQSLMIMVWAGDDYLA